MKLKVGDQVLVTGGKDKGKRSVVVKVVPTENKVVVKDVNIYARHIKPNGGRAGEIVRRERALPVANVAIINDKGQPDRIGYKVDKAGQKVRIYRKTGQAVAQADAAKTTKAVAKPKTKDKKEDKKPTKSSKKVK